jgi:hypothetical protein
MMVWCFVNDINVPMVLMISVVAVSAMSRALFLIVRSNCCADSGTHTTAYNRPVSTSDFIANCCTSGTTYAASNCRIHGGTISICFNCKQDNC